MLEYVNQLWQTFLNRPDFWAVLSIIPVTAYIQDMIIEREAVKGLL